MTLNHHKSDVVRTLPWGPSAGVRSAPIIAALRAAGFEAMIGSRPLPAQNFEVTCLPGQMDEVAEIILGIDPGATRLNVGR